MHFKNYIKSNKITTVPKILLYLCIFTEIFTSSIKQDNLIFYTQQAVICTNKKLIKNN